MQDQISFLHSHGMIEEKHIAEADQDWLQSINFHHLIGYARNYRELVNRKIIDEKKTLSQIRSIIDMEAKLSAFMVPWLREAEWHLRALTVKNYCEEQQHGEGYLNISRWTSRHNGDREKLQQEMVASIFRHREPYVTNHIKDTAIATKVQIPKFYNPRDHEICLDLIKELPLWSVIDSFSVGTLGKFIALCGMQPGTTENCTVKEGIAKELEILPKFFDKTVDSFAITRNSIFHHQRLWMRPMPKSPGLPNFFDRRYKKYDLKEKNKQAQFIALISTSRLLPKKNREAYLDGLESTISENEIFKIGITQCPFS